jgi:hypothetical protein
VIPGPSLSYRKLRAYASPPSMDFEATSRASATTPPAVSKTAPATALAPFGMPFRASEIQSQLTSIGQRPGLYRVGRAVDVRRPTSTGVVAGPQTRQNAAKAGCPRVCGCVTATPRELVPTRARPPSEIFDDQRAVALRHGIWHRSNHLHQSLGSLAVVCFDEKGRMPFQGELGVGAHGGTLGAR